MEKSKEMIAQLRRELAEKEVSLEESRMKSTSFFATEKDNTNLVSAMDTLKLDVFNQSMIIMKL